jgi:hypothetical protein
MKIDNQRNTYRIWLSRLVMTIVFTLAIIIILFLPWFDEPGALFTKYHAIIFIALVYILINLVNYLKRPYFVAYSDQGEKIIMRYYPLSLFTSRKNSIEIPKTQFVKYEIKPFLFGTQQWIILYQNFRNKEAKYPPISLSAVDKADREQIINSLEKNRQS